MSRFLAFSLMFTVALAAGCSSSGTPTGSGEPTRKDELREVAQMLTLAGGETGRAPKKVEDFAKYESGCPFGYRAVQSGQIVVVWGATMPGEGAIATAPPDVVAYEKKTPTDGGWVLLLNGTVKEMTAAEFAAAPKAK